MTWRTMASAPSHERVLVIGCAESTGYRAAVHAASFDGAHWWLDRSAGRVVLDVSAWQPLPSTDLTAPCPVVEAEIRGMERAMDMAHSHFQPWRHENQMLDAVDVAVDAAIAELREGK
jgi:hypothetical protein